MRAASRPPNPDVRLKHFLRRLLEAIDRAVSASQDVERARAALVREAARLGTVRLAAEQEDNTNER